MTYSSLSDELTGILVNQGADLVGFADTGDILPLELRHLPRAVSIGVRLLDSILDEMHAGPTMTYFHHYRTVNAHLDQLTLFAAKFIERRGYKALPLPASQTVNNTDHRGLFQHKTAACLAGLGWIGRSALFVSPEFGPRVRLATVLTDAKLKTADSRLDVGCKDCMVCVRLCPAGAISGNQWQLGMQRSDFYDAHKCSEHMKREYSHIGRGAVCGICVACCPYGKRNHLQNRRSNV